jgi:hypothetical protein
VFLIEQAVLEQPRTLLYWLTQHTQDDILENFQVTADNRLQFWLMFYLLPNTLLIAEAVRFWKTHKYLVAIAVVVGAVNERAQLTSRARRAHQTILASSESNAGRARLALRVCFNDVCCEAVASLVSAAFLFFFWRPVWRCVPWFLCDIDFYYHITVVPIFKLLGLLSGSARDRTSRVQNPILTGLSQGIRNAMPGSTLRAPEPRPVMFALVGLDLSNSKSGVNYCVEATVFRRPPSTTQSYHIYCDIFSQYFSIDRITDVCRCTGPSHW